MAIEIPVVSDSAAARQDLAKLRESVDKIGKSADNVSSHVNRLISGLTTAVVSIGTVAVFTKYSDVLTGISSKLRLATADQVQYADALQKTKQIALDTRSNLEDTVTLYSKVSMAARALGANQAQIATVTSNVAKAIAASGANATEANSAILQLGQALASGRLQGDELRAILEAAPELANQIAKGMGKTVSEMRMLGAEGRLTSKDVFESLLKSTNEINAKAKNIGVTFGGAFTNIRNAGLILFDAIKNYKGIESGEGNGTSKTIASRINDVAIAIAKMGMDFDQTVLNMRVSFWRFIDDAARGIKGLPNNIASGAKTAVDSATDSLSKAVSSEFNGIKIAGFTFKFDLTKIKIEDFIPKLEPMKKLILDWCYAVERAFFWVYDRVIGHSWIPDLVLGVIFWTSLLLKAPMTFVKTFTEFVDNAFHSIFVAIDRDARANQVVFETLGQKAEVLSPLESAIHKIRVGFSGLIDFLKNNSIADNISKSLNSEKIALASSKLIRNTKQVLGIRDTIPGSYEDRTEETIGRRQYDNNAQVGRGSFRSSAQRPLLHDITNAFKSENQVPFLAALTTTFGVALVSAFSGAGVFKTIAATFATGIAVAIGSAYDKSIPIFALIGGGIAAAIWGSGTTKLIAAAITTAFGLVSAQVVSDKELKKTTGETAKIFIDSVHKAIELLFGSGIFGEKGFGGTLMLIAKIALLFEQGRKSLGAAALAFAKSPTTLADNLSDRVANKYYNGKIQETKSTLGDLGNTANNKIIRAQADIAQAMNNLRSTRLMSNTAHADAFINGNSDTRKQLLATYDKSTKAAAAQLMAAERQLQAADAFKTSIPSKTKELKSVLNDLTEKQKAVADRIKESNDNFKKGVTNTAMGIGAVFGTMGGFSIGKKISDQMVGYSDWAKIGVEIGAAMVGQAAGAGLGSAIGNSFIWAITNKWVLLAGLIVSAFGIAFDMWTNYPWWQKQFEQWATLGEVWLKSLLKLIPGIDSKNIDSGKTMLNPLRWADLGSDIISRMGLISPGEVTGGAIRAAKDIGSISQGSPAVDDIYSGASLSGMLDEARKGLDKFFSFFVSSAKAAEVQVAGDINTNIIEPLNRATRKDISIKPSQTSDFDLLVSAIRSRETGGHKDPANAISPQGAMGSMQITQATFDTYKKSGEVFSKESDRVAAALRKLAADFDATGGDVRKTAGMYIAGSLDKNGNIRETKDALGTSATKYADQVYAKFQDAKKGKGSSTKVPVETTALERAKTIKDDVVGKLESIAKKLGIITEGAGKLPEIEGPPLPPKVKIPSLSSQLEHAGTAAESLELINNALASVNGTLLSAKNFEALSPEQIDQLVTNFDNIVEMQERASDAGWLTKKRLEALADELKLKNRKLAEAFSKEGGDNGKLNDTPSEDAKKAGVDAAIKVRDNLVTAINDVFHGRFGGIGRFFKNTAIMLGDTIIDSFAKGLATAFLKESGLEEKIQKMVTGSMFSGEKRGGADGLGGAVKKWWNSKFGGTEGTLPASLSGGEALFSSASTIENVTDSNFGKDLLNKTGMDSAISDLTDTMKGFQDSFMKDLSSGNSMLGGDTTARVDEVVETFSDKIGTAFDGVVGDISSSLKDVGFSFDGVMSGIGDGISGLGDMLSGLMSSMSDIGSSIMDFIGMLFLADGGPVGHVRGPGTSRSDSIPAMLSNGEFVVNASATKRFAPLLEAINSGKVPKFADGGYVDTSTASTKLILAAGRERQSTSGNPTVIHLNITGDISRQTRKEVLSLIPEIATGVNIHQKERGRR